jgi:hypothetical protein
MKLAEAIRSAVENEDWQQVCDIYEAITGDVLEPPKPKLIIPTTEDLANMDLDALRQNEGALELDIMPKKLEVIRDSVPEPEEEEEVESTQKKSSYIATAHKGDSPSFRGGEDEDKGTPARKMPMDIPVERVNKFEDDGRLCVRDKVENNKNLQKLYGDRRDRPRRTDLEDAVDTSKKIDVVCSLCDEEDNIALSLAHGYDSRPKFNRYRCTRCCTKSGQAKIARKNKQDNVSRKR